MLLRRRRAVSSPRLGGRVACLLRTRALGGWVKMSVYMPAPKMFTLVKSVDCLIYCYLLIVAVRCQDEAVAGACVPDTASRDKLFVDDTPRVEELGSYA